MVVSPPMRKLIIFLTVFISLTALGQTSAADAAKEEAAIRSVLTAQMEAWNRGDLEGYMKIGYWNSPELAFIGGSSESRGYEGALERYRKSYKSAGKEMGQLDFPEMRVTVLGPDAAFATGKFHLKMSDGKEPSGRYTVILKKFPEGWRIIHDHSCN